MTKERNMNKKEKAVKSKYTYLVGFLTDHDNIICVYSNYIEFYCYGGVNKRPTHGFEYPKKLKRKEIKIIGRLLIKEGFTAISPREVAVQASLGTFPVPRISFSLPEVRLIRGYVRNYGNTRTN